jgi:putative heme transporter
VSPRVKHVVEAVIGLGLAAVLLIWGLPHFAKTTWGDIWEVIGGVPPSHALGFQVLMLVGLWSYTFTFTGSLHGLTHSRALIVNLCGSSISNLLPGGGAVGLAATYGICRSWGFSKRATSTSAIVTGVWNVMARIALPVAAIASLWIGGVTLPEALTDLAVAGMVTGLGILVTFIAVMVSERAAQAIGRGLDHVIGPLLRRRRPNSTMSPKELVHDLRARLNDVVGSGWWSMTLGMIGFFGAYYVLFVLVLRETGVVMPLNLLFAAFAIGRLLTAVGITPGGVGVTETATAAVLVAWGADPAGATAGVVLFSIFTHLMEVPLGALGWLLWTLSPKVEPPTEGDEHAFARATT